MQQPLKFYQTGTFTVGNRLLAAEQRTVQADIGRANALNSGHRADPSMVPPCWMMPPTSRMPSGTNVPAISPANPD